MKIRFAFLLTMIVSMFCSVSAQQTKRLTADKHNEYGLVYSLPSTALEIEVEVTHRVEKSGPFYSYAKKYIGTSDVIIADKESWTLTGLNVRRFGINSGQDYLMQLKSGALTSIYVDESGMIRSINVEPEELPDNIGFTPKKMQPSSLDDNEYLKYVTEDFLVSQSSAKKAQILAQSLMEIRDAKLSLSRGTAESMPTDGHQLELMLTSLAQQEQSITDAFVGTVQTETVVKKFVYVPSDTLDSKEVLFRLSDFAGFVDADDYSGDPVYIDVDIVRHAELPVNEKGEEKKLPKDAVIYTIPGEASVNISFLGQTLYDEVHPFSQFGVNFGLNPSLFNSKKEPSYVIFDPTTGAIEDIGVINMSEE